jgi:class 3 adenylate cyclase
MQRCPVCAQDNPEGFRFCGACGAALAPTPAPGLGQERRLVTVLFCDLVGFTARADHADPEDVGNLLRPYHAQLRHQIHRFGGTLDKFVGDAAMAVFGTRSPTRTTPSAPCAARWGSWPRSRTSTAPTPPSTSPCGLG